jgi:hypothetical protein
VLGGDREGHIYPRLHHAEVAEDPTVLKRIKAWYVAYGLL